MKYLALITLILFIGCNAHRTSLSDDNIKDDTKYTPKEVVLNPEVFKLDKKVLDSQYLATYITAYENKKIKIGSTIIQINKGDVLIRYIKINN